MVVCLIIVPAYAASSAHYGADGIFIAVLCVPACCQTGYQSQEIVGRVMLAIEVTAALVAHGRYYQAGYLRSVFWSPRP